MPPRRALLPLLLLAGALPSSRAAADPPLAFVAPYFHVEASLDGLQGSISCVVSPDGKHVYLAAKADDAVSEWSRDAATSALLPLGRVLGDSQMGGDIPNFDRPQVLAQSPDGLFLYVGVGNTTATSTSGIAIFERDPDSGLLTHQGGVIDGQDGAQLTRPFALAADAGFVFAGDFGLGTEVGAINVFRRDAATGQLTRIQTLSHAGPSVVDGLDRVRWLALSPDGQSLYAASHGDNALGVYQRDAGTGMLVFMQALQHGVGGVSGLVDPWGIQVSPDGAQVYVASHGGGLDGSLDVFSRNAQTGELAALDSIAQADVGFENPDDVALSPDATRVYVTAQGALGAYDGKLAVFSRDPATGVLTLLDLIADDANGVDGLRGALGVAVSPDGRSVYVASEQDAPPSPPQSERGALAAFRAAPEPAAGAAEGAALAVLAQLSASQSRGRRKTSERRASGVPGAGRQS